MISRFYREWFNAWKNEAQMKAVVAFNNEEGPEALTLFNNKQTVKNLKQMMKEEMIYTEKQC